MNPKLRRPRPPPIVAAALACLGLLALASVLGALPRSRVMVGALCNQVVQNVSAEACAAVPVGPRAAPGMRASLVMMPADEVAKLGALLARARDAAAGRMAYLEYGSGGSTTEFARFANVAVSVEHDGAWCETVRGRLRDAGVRHVRQMCTPREAHDASHGGSEGDYVSYRAYVDSIDAAGLPRTYDFVLIDGRARLGAALKVLPFLHDESIVVLHDAARKRYDDVSKYYKVLSRDMSAANFPRLKNGFMVLKRRADLANGTWPLTPQQIDQAYLDVADLEA